MDVMWYLLATAIVIAVLAARISHVRARERSRRIRALIELTHRLLGKTPHDHPLLGGDDIGLLERSLSLVEAETRAVVDRLNIEASLREAILSSIGEGVLAVDKDL